MKLEWIHSKPIFMQLVVFFSPDQSDTDIDCRHFLVQNAGKYGDK